MSSKADEWAEIQEAFHELVHQDTGKLLRMAFGLMSNREEAKDLVQDALLKAHRALGSFRSESSLLTWVRRILANEGLKRLRHRKLTLRLFSGTEGMNHHQSQWLLLNRVDSSTPEKQATFREQLGHVGQALVKMSPRQRTIFVLRFFEEFSVEEISETLDIEPGTVKTHLVRALHAVRSMQEQSEKKGGS